MHIKSISLCAFYSCTDNKKVVIPKVESSIFVLPAAHPVITVSGSGMLTEAEAKFQFGVPIFRDVMIVSKTEAERKEYEEDKVRINPYTDDTNSL